MSGCTVVVEDPRARASVTVEPKVKYNRDRTYLDYAVVVAARQKPGHEIFQAVYWGSFDGCYFRSSQRVAFGMSSLPMRSYPRFNVFSRRINDTGTGCFRNEPET